MAKSREKSAKDATTKGSAKPQAAGNATPQAAVGVGSRAPRFKLVNQLGQTRQLEDFRGKWVVLYFYPKDDTPGCTTEACGFRDGLARFAEGGAVVLGISPDDAKSHARFALKFKLPFELLADPEKAACMAYGVWGEKSMYGRKYMGVIRTTFLIDPKGKVAARWDRVTPKGHEEEVLARLKELA